MQIKFKKLRPDAVQPSRVNKEDAGSDLYALEDTVIPPHGRKLIKTGIAVEIPAGYYGRIADRSGNAYKKGLHCLAGVVDCTYRGEIGVVLFNTNPPETILTPGVEIKAGDRIAQLIIEMCVDAEWAEVEFLDETARAASGFGSSGS